MKAILILSFLFLCLTAQAQSASEILKKFIESSKEEVLEVEKEEKETKEGLFYEQFLEYEKAKELDKPILKTRLALKAEQKQTYFPLLISHTPETLSSVSLLKTKDNLYLHFQSELFQARYKKIPLLKNWLGELDILDPNLTLGVISSVQNNDFNFFISVKTKLRIKKHGFGVKATLENTDYQELLGKTSGRLTVYYYHARTFFFTNNDLISVYAGWHSEEININLKNIDAFVGQFKSIKKQKDNLQLGVHYLPNIFKKCSFGFETNLVTNYYLTFYYKI